MAFTPIGVGISAPSALNPFGVETAPFGVETKIPMPKGAGVGIGVGISHRRWNVSKFGFSMKGGQLSRSDMGGSLERWSLGASHRR